MRFWPPLRLCSCRRGRVLRSMPSRKWQPASSVRTSSDCKAGRVMLSSRDAWRIGTIRAAGRLLEPSPGPSNSAKTCGQSQAAHPHHRRLALDRGALAGLTTRPHGPPPLPAALDCRETDAFYPETAWVRRGQVIATGSRGTHSSKQMYLYGFF
jgi:hypothetical protein